MNRVELRAGKDALTASCGHTVIAHAHFFGIVPDAKAYVAGMAVQTDEMKTACSPECAARMERS